MGRELSREYGILSCHRTSAISLSSVITLSYTVAAELHKM
jgi:hypothetical protein